MTDLKNFFQSSDDDRLAYYKEEYEVHEKSWPEIAKQLGTYTNKVSRDAKKLGIETRSKSSAQKLTLEQGKVQHPTKGKKRTIEERAKIGKTQRDNWDNLSDAEKAKRAKISKDRWDAMTEKEKEDFRKASIAAIHETAKTGSKLEKSLLKGLLNAGYRVDFHKEHFLKRERLQIDLMLPELKIGIEVDGPSHWKNVWGEDALERTQQSDKLKEKLILGYGYSLIRVRQKQKLSMTYKNQLLKRVIDEVEKLKEKNVPLVVIIDK